MNGYRDRVVLETLMNQLLPYYFAKVGTIEKRMSDLEKKVCRRGSAYKNIPSPEEPYGEVKDFTPVDESGKEEFEKGWQKELDFFMSIREKLRKDKNLKDKFVAVKGNKVVDSDADDIRLTKRIGRKYPHVPVLIAKVEEERKATEVPSPEVVG